VVPQWISGVVFLACHCTTLCLASLQKWVSPQIANGSKHKSVNQIWSLICGQPDSGVWVVEHHPTSRFLVNIFNVRILVYNCSCFFMMVVARKPQMLTWHRSLFVLLRLSWQRVYAKLWHTRKRHVLLEAPFGLSGAHPITKSQKIPSCHFFGHSIGLSVVPPPADHSPVLPLYL